jgi:hypothetical protein
MWHLLVSIVWSCRPLRIGISRCLIWWKLSFKVDFTSWGSPFAQWKQISHSSLQVTELVYRYLRLGNNFAAFHALRHDFQKNIYFWIRDKNTKGVIPDWMCDISRCWWIWVIDVSIVLNLNSDIFSCRLILCKERFCLIHVLLDESLFNSQGKVTISK